MFSLAQGSPVSRPEGILCGTSHTLFHQRARDSGPSPQAGTSRLASPGPGASTDPSVHATAQVTQDQTPFYGSPLWSRQRRAELGLEGGLQEERGSCQCQQQLSCRMPTQTQSLGLPQALKVTPWKPSADVPLLHHLHATLATLPPSHPLLSHLSGKGATSRDSRTQQDKTFAANVLTCFASHTPGSSPPGKRHMLGPSSSGQGLKSCP